MCLGWKWEYKQKTEKILHLLIHVAFSQSLLSTITYILVGVKYTDFYSLQILVTSERPGMPGVAVSVITLCSEDTAASAGTVLVNGAGRGIIPNALDLFVSFILHRPNNNIKSKATEL